MRIVTAQLHRYAIPLRQDFVTAASHHTHREGLIVELTDDAGRTGLGETAPLPGLSSESLTEAETAARQYCAELVTRELAADPDAIRAALPSPDACPASTRCGLETALADLAAQTAGRPLARFLAEDAATVVPYNAVLPADATTCPPDVEVLKVKMGALAPADDRRRLEALLAEAPPRVRLRLDANRAWTPRQALTVLEGLPVDRIEYVEEPLVPAHLDDLDEVHRRCGLLFALDETLADPRRWAELLRREAVGAMVLKPTLLGGLFPALALGAAARARDKQVVVTTTLEAGVGTAACLHLAAAVATAPCGLDTLRFLSDTLLVEDPQVEDGAMRVPSESGLGVRLDRRSLETVATFGGESDG